MSTNLQSNSDLVHSAHLDQHDAAAMRTLERFCHDSEFVFPPTRLTEWVEFVMWARTRPTEYIIASNGTRRRSAAVSDTSLEATLKRIDRVLSNLGIPNFARDHRIKALQKRLASRHRHPRRDKRALTPEKLRRVVRSCDKATKPGKRCEALILLLWHLAGRISEICRLRVEDISFIDGFGMMVRICKSKMNDTHYPEYVKIPAAKDQELCAVRAVREWLSLADITDGPLFPKLLRSHAYHITDVAPTPSAIYRTFNAAFIRAGIDPKGLGTHCCRRGNITERARQGQTSEEIGAHSRQKDPRELAKYVMRTELSSVELDQMALT